VQEDYVSRRIGWLANNEIRRSLTLCQNIILSPHLSIDDLLTTYASGNEMRMLNVSYEKFMRALILGDYNAFSSEDNSFVSNVFASAGDTVSTPLLKLSVIKLLIDKAGGDGGLGGYLTIGNIRQYFDAMGIDESIVDEAVASLLEFRLVEPYDASDGTVWTGQRVAITHSEECISKWQPRIRPTLRSWLFRRQFG